MPESAFPATFPGRDGVALPRGEARRPSVREMERNGGRMSPVLWPMGIVQSKSRPQMGSSVSPGFPLNNCIVLSASFKKNKMEVKLIPIQIIICRIFGGLIA